MDAVVFFGPYVLFAAVVQVALWRMLPRRWFAAVFLAISTSLYLVWWFYGPKECPPNAPPCQSEGDGLADIFRVMFLMPFFVWAVASVLTAFGLGLYVASRVLGKRLRSGHVK